MIEGSLQDDDAAKVFVQPVTSSKMLSNATNNRHSEGSHPCSKFHLLWTVHNDSHLGPPVRNQGSSRTMIFSSKCRPVSADPILPCLQVRTWKAPPQSQSAPTSLDQTTECRKHLHQLTEGLPIKIFCSFGSILCQVPLLCTGCLAQSMLPRTFRAESLMSSST